MRRCAQCMFVDGISANSNPISTRAKMHVVACNWGVPSMSYLGISLSQALASGKTCEKAISGVCGFKLTVHFPERGRPPPLVGELKAAGCVERCKVRHVLPFHLVQEGTPMYVMLTALNKYRDFFHGKQAISSNVGRFGGICRSYLDDPRI